MTDKIKLALLGHKPSQEELTRDGIAIPCPCCKGKAVLIEWKQEHCLVYKIKCLSCGLSTIEKEGSNYINSHNKNYPSRKQAKEMVLGMWNSRPQLVVSCEECKHYESWEIDFGYCCLHGIARVGGGYCEDGERVE